MIGPKTLAQHRPRTCGECWAGPRGKLPRDKCAKGGGQVGKSSKACEWGMTRAAKDDGPQQRGLF